MTFVDMVRDLKRDFAAARLPKSNAMMQLAGMVKEMVASVTSVGRDAEAAAAEMGKARARVYMPKKTKAKEDSEVASVRKAMEDKEKAAAERKAVKDKLSTLEAFTKADRMAQDEMIGQVLSARRAKVREREAAKAAKLKAAEERTEGIRAEFKGRFERPETVGKTERFEAYISELKAAVEKERAGFDAAGVAYKNTALLKELAKAQETGKIQKVAADARGEKLLGKLSDETRVVGQTVSGLHEDMTAQLLGPFAGIYKTSKNFMVTTLKHYTVDKKDALKRWFQERFDQKKLLAEMAHLRKENQEISGTLRLQMLLSTVMNGLMTGIGTLLKASPFLALGAIAITKLGESIGKAISEKLPWWMGGSKGEGERFKAEEEAAAARDKRRESGDRTSKDIAIDRLGKAMAALTQFGRGPLSKEEQDLLARLKEEQSKLTESEAVPTKGRLIRKAVGTVAPFLVPLGIGEYLSDRRDREGARNERIDELITNVDRLTKATEKAVASPAGAAVNINSMASSGGGGEKVHPNVAKNADLYTGPSDDEILW